MKNKLKYMISFVFSLTLICLATPLTLAQESSPLNIVTTNSILADMVQEIGQDRVNVHSIVPIGQDPHEYEPLPEDVKKTEQADLIFYNGINLENGSQAWFTKLVKNANKVADQDYFAVSAGVDIIYLEGEDEAGKEDPHAWLDLNNGVIYCQNIADTLIQADPGHAEFYQENLANYTKKLQALDQEARHLFDHIPSDQKLIVTSEGCFKYFSKAYNIPSAYIWEINTEEEGTPEQITALVRQIKASKIPSLFVETSVDDRPMKTVAQETGRPIYAKIFTDSIAASGETGDSYYSMMEYNLKTIAAGLNP